MNNKRGSRFLKKSKKNSQVDAKLRAFASAVGNFIRYWGFRGIHGQIWAQVFLSKLPLSGADLTRSLQVSKALVSPALQELLKYKLIIGSGGDKKTKLYVANPMVFQVIEGVLMNREKKLLDQAQRRFVALYDVSQGADSAINLHRLEEVGAMIAMANVGIDILLNKINETNHRTEL